MALYDDFLYGLGGNLPGTGIGIPSPVGGYTPNMPGGIGVPSPVQRPLQPVPVGTGAPPLRANVLHPEYGTYYNPPGKDMYDTRFVRERVSPLLPQGEYQRYLNARGMGDPNSALGRWAQNQYGRFQQQFQAAQLSNPALTWRRYLQTGGPGKIMREFLNLSPEQRGVGPRQTRTQVVGWG